MPQVRTPALSVVPPDAGEAAALARAAAYLARAGTQVASLLLVAPADGALLTALRDELLGGAATCDGVLDLVPGANVRRIHPHARPLRARSSHVGSRLLPGLTREARNRVLGVCRSSG